MAGSERAGAKEEETIYVGFPGKTTGGCRSHRQAHMKVRQVFRSAKPHFSW